MKNTFNWLYVENNFLFYSYIIVITTIILITIFFVTKELKYKDEHK